MSKNEKVVCDICECDKVDVREDAVDLCGKCYKMVSIISAQCPDWFAPTVEVAHD